MLVCQFGSPLRSAPNSQTSNLTHTVTANYQEDTYRLVMGRYILFGVKWNFGKMNASHSRRASRAAWNMVF